MAKRASFIEAEALKGHKVWVCVHCGAINPARPGPSCNHYQLALFEDLDGEALEAVQDLSKARRALHEALGRFNDRLEGLVRQGQASIGAGTVERQADQGRAPGGREDAFALEPIHPRKPRASSAQRPKRKEIPVDPRQLALLAFIKPGDA